MNQNIASRLVTDTPLIKDLISEIKKGEIKVPQFQRPFVWKEEQAIRLLDSISSSYPVGSLLLWRTKSKLATERNIGDFKLPDADDMSPTNYVLDGQQRLTVIYACFGAPDEEDGFNVVFDLNKQEFSKKTDIKENYLFPLRWIFITTKLLNFRTALSEHPEATVFQERLDKLIDIITNYRIPVVILKELTVEEVCPIFERINSSGTRLSTYDLMVAATWTQTFNLNDEVKAISEALEAKRYEEISGDTILKCLSAIKYTSTKKDTILSLRKLSRAEMNSLVDTTKEALLKTVDLLTTEFKIYSWAFLPYEAILVIICFIYARKNTLDQEAHIRLKRWFWSSAFAERYRGAADSLITSDLTRIEEYIVNCKDVPGLLANIPSKDELASVLFRSNVSRTRAFILLLASLNPQNITNGAKIDVTNALSVFNQKQFHHIYPKAYLKNLSIDDRQMNLISNICMLSASENNLIRDNDPNKYIPNLIEQLDDRYEDIFKTNLLPILKANDYRKLAYDEFLELRIELIHERMSLMCNGKI
ncbi:GmrSD restriction endonuclease domain-containing protein [Geovibrio ferrireducens]|uniref:GmrSD restriction endonuclease domain-containing protein n=1 Tax=Geovibrio ferrireducens TaxID=46201 RepID=UPI002245036B|nr:DUF262 domain-containing protein [Geovibrio ferrireducens]